MVEVITPLPFWEVMSPDGGGELGELAEAINAIRAHSKALKRSKLQLPVSGQAGPGFAHDGGRVAACSSNQDNPLMPGVGAEEPQYLDLTFGSMPTT